MFNERETEGLVRVCFFIGCSVFSLFESSWRTWVSKLFLIFSLSQLLWSPEENLCMLLWEMQEVLTLIKAGENPGEWTNITILICFTQISHNLFGILIHHFNITTSNGLIIALFTLFTKLCLTQIITKLHLRIWMQGWFGPVSTTSILAYPPEG